MKITYLLQRESGNGSSCLFVATADEWKAVVQANRVLPAEQRRYFIRDYIAEGKELDCMVIETSAEEYRAWNREHMAAERNRAAGKEFQHISLDAKPLGTDSVERIGDAVAASEQVEELIFEELLMDHLRAELARWKPWATELLDLYLKEEKKTCTAAFAAKQGISQQTARKYKRQFEDFIKKFLAGVSF